MTSSAVVRLSLEISMKRVGVVIDNEKVSVLFPLEQICPDFLPRKFRQTRWYQWFKPLGLYFTTLCATPHHLLQLFGKSWPPYGLSGTFTTFSYSLVSSVNSVQHFKSECCWYNNSAGITILLPRISNPFSTDSSAATG